VWCAEAGDSDQKGAESDLRGTAGALRNLPEPNGPVVAFPGLWQVWTLPSRRLPRSETGTVAPGRVPKLFPEGCGSYGCQGKRATERGVVPENAGLHLRERHESET